ncbi:MAG TPA: nucleotidyltransferase domain-containing protein [Chitinophaga sp.]|uniref:nucleotidyltransferase domain-containing protein n=1 Tax=Chitinophaga sp. TaxID=1869181 RepID=UPI002C12CAE8|nr:nucleotidyltransferase domain-containing protein [Chitinophaga sp.]HVI47986.1 nucleotidyltransferase domain-containing protein [Chitinophaga sp.]
MERTVASIVAYIVHLVQPESVMLFGSVNRGTYNSNSDIDLLVVAVPVDDRNRLVKQIRAYAAGLSVKVDILIRTPDEVRTAVSEPTSFINAVMKEGRVLYRLVQ